MKEPFKKRSGFKGWNRLMSFDSWVDDGMFRMRSGGGETWENVTLFFRRFRVFGVKRAAVELACEGLTLGLVGVLALMGILKMTAYDRIDSDWRSRKEWSVTFLDRFGNEIGRRGVLHDESVPVDDLPDHFIKTVLATEDRRFFEHFGIDFFGLARAVIENARAGGVVQGGSTLTQQLAKNVFLSNERSLERKINEAFLSLWLEYNLSKKEILRLYLDRAYMGGSANGAAAAAKFYFDKPITDVNLAESAMLAGLFKAPSKYAPHRNLPAARARANEVLTNLVQANFMTEGQVVSARRNPATAVERAEKESPDYFLDWAFAEVQRLAVGFPTTTLVVKTTFDPSLQLAAEDAITSHLRQFGDEYRVQQGSLVTIENGGEVRAVVGGRDYGESQYNRATQARRQSGSSFKPFVYAAALEKLGLGPTSSYSASGICIRNWCPKNYGGKVIRGRVPLTTALVKSYNTVPVRLGVQMGRGPIIEIAQRMGITSPLQGVPAMVLGTNDLTAYELAASYGVLMSGGYQTNAHGVLYIQDTAGEVLYSHERDAPKPKRVLSDEVVAGMNEMMRQIPEWGTARRAKLDGIRTAGKTGTTQSYRDAWFVGYTGNYTTAVWFGNDDSKLTRDLTGGRLPSMAFKKFMTYAHRDIALKPIPFVEPEEGGPPTEPQVAEGEGEAALAIQAARQQPLPRPTAELLRQLERELRSAPPLAPAGPVAAAPASDAAAVQVAER